MHISNALDPAVFPHTQVVGKAGGHIKETIRQVRCAQNRLQNRPQNRLQNNRLQASPRLLECRILNEPQKTRVRPRRARPARA